MAQSSSRLAEALANAPKPALATLSAPSPKLTPGDAVQIPNMSGGFGSPMGGDAASNALAQYGPGGLVGQQMVTSLLSGNLPWLKPIPQLQGRVDTGDLKSLNDELNKGKKK